MNLKADVSGGKYDGYQSRENCCSQQKPDEKNLGFGKFYTDHIVVMDYDAGQAGMVQESFLMARFLWNLPA